VTGIRRRIRRQRNKELVKRLERDSHPGKGESRVASLLTLAAAAEREAVNKKKQDTMMGRQRNSKLSPIR
jgi:hypothetical protein